LDPGVDVWLGGNSLAYKGEWVWTDGSPVKVKKIAIF